MLQKLKSWKLWCWVFEQVRTQKFTSRYVLAQDWLHVAKRPVQADVYQEMQGQTSYVGFNMVKKSPWNNSAHHTTMNLHSDYI